MTVNQKLDICLRMLIAESMSPNRCPDPTLSKQLDSVVNLIRVLKSVLSKQILDSEVRHVEK
jgi:hypothetical protein